MRFYYLTPQWDESLQASNFVPSEFDRNNAARLYTPVCIGAPALQRHRRRGMDPRSLAPGVTPTAANTVADRFIGRLTPDSNRFNGSFQAGQGITDTLQDGNTFKISPRVGVVYDMTGKGEMIFRGGWGIFYDRPQGNMVFDMIANAPGVLNSSVQCGRLQDLQQLPAAAASRTRRWPEPDGVRLRAAARDAVEPRPPEEAVQQLHVRPGLRRLQVG